MRIRGVMASIVAGLLLLGASPAQAAPPGTVLTAPFVHEEPSSWCSIDESVPPPLGSCAISSAADASTGALSADIDMFAPDYPGMFARGHGESTPSVGADYVVRRQVDALEVVATFEVPHGGYASWRANALRNPDVVSYADYSGEGSSLWLHLYGVAPDGARMDAGSSWTLAEARTPNHDADPMVVQGGTFELRTVLRASGGVGPGVYTLMGGLGALTNTHEHGDRFIARGEATLVSLRVTEVVRGS